jgi:phosphoglycerate dehydrogenase-like enzyme
MNTIWCQWNDLKLPDNFKLISNPISSLSQSELDEIDFYVPKYMGGLEALSVIPQLTNLKIIQLLMAGYDDVLPFKRPNIKLYNARGVHDFSTAELTLGLIISSLRGIDTFVRSQAQGVWAHQRLDSLYGKKVGIVGAGSVAKKIRELLIPFQIQPILFGQTAREEVRSINELDSLIGDLDIVILIVPLTDATRNLMDKKRIAAMKPGSLLVNVARGPVVNTQALVEALNSGHIRAAVDVTDPEPLPSDHPLWRAPNIIISPHVGGDSAAFEPHGRALVEAQCQRFSEGKSLINEIAW